MHASNDKANVKFGFEPFSPVGDYAPVMPSPARNRALRAAAGGPIDAAGRSIDLPRPVRRALRADEQLEVDDGELESAREQALESRVREAEAGLRWMEEQLRHERKRRRLFEQERASLEKRNEALREELQELSAHAIELSGLSR